MTNETTPDYDVLVAELRSDECIAHPKEAADAITALLTENKALKDKIKAITSMSNFIDIAMDDLNG